MQVNISARHGHLAQETQDKITQRLEKLSRFHDRISSVQVTIDLSNPSSPDVEMLVSVDRAHDFFCKTQANGGKLIGAVDAAMDKIGEQLKRHKQKRIDQHRAATPRHEPPTDEVEDDEDE